MVTEDGERERERERERARERERDAETCPATRLLATTTAAETTVVLRACADCCAYTVRHEWRESRGGAQPTADQCAAGDGMALRRAATHSARLDGCTSASLDRSPRPAATSGGVMTLCARHKSRSQRGQNVRLVREGRRPRRAREDGHSATTLGATARAHGTSATWRRRRSNAHGAAPMRTTLLQCAWRRSNAHAPLGAFSKPSGGHTHVLIMSVMLSPFRRMRPSALRVFFLMDSSSASSSTKFMYSSKPYERRAATSAQ